MPWEPEDTSYPVISGDFPKVGSVGEFPKRWSQHHSAAGLHAAASMPFLPEVLFSAHVSLPGGLDSSPQPPGDSTASSGRWGLVSPTRPPAEPGLCHTLVGLPLLERNTQLIPFLHDPNFSIPPATLQLPPSRMYWEKGGLSPHLPLLCHARAVPSPDGPAHPCAPHLTPPQPLVSPPPAWALSPTPC